LRADDFLVEEREQRVLACPCFVEANSSSCLSLIDLYMLLDAPLSFAHARLAALDGECRPDGQLRCWLGWHVEPPRYELRQAINASCVSLPSHIAIAPAERCCEQRDDHANATGHIRVAIPRLP